VSADPHRSDRVGRRAAPRIAIGFLVGPVVGAVLGLGAGILVFGAGTRGMWASVIAGLVFGGLGGFWGGLASLGPPAPDDDPLPRVPDREPSDPA
jgi:hypothetical protein